MGQYKRYKLQLELKSRLGTPLSADTLFGHLCWGIVYHEGQGRLTEFLQQMKSSTPPLIISDPLPAGYLPTPKLPLGTIADEWIADYTERKKILKTQWLRIDLMQGLLDNLTCQTLYKSLEEQHKQNRNEAFTPFQAATVTSNTINRITQHTAEEGGLYTQTDYFPKDHANNFDVYIISTLKEEYIKQIFQWGLEAGYGRDVSTGRGRIDVGQITPLDDWPAAKNPNSIVTLGVCAPAADDPADGFWNIEVRFGKVSGAWATLFDKPFKYPLLLLTAGSLLSPCPANPNDKPYIGRIVEQIHPENKQIITYALAPFITVNASCPGLTTATNPQNQQDVSAISQEDT